MTSELILELIKQLPESPGVYLMRNTRGNILYVGKAVNLRNRVKSYFTSPAKLTPKTSALVENIHDFEYFVVTSEQEALILELNLIKRYWPPYNVLLKDDKTFPYLKIKSKEPWPRLYITRRLEDDGSRYFGPFASINSLRQSLDVLKRIFPLRTCAENIDSHKRARPCLKFDMGYCLAPCTGKISRNEYNILIKQLIQFLEGKHEKVTRALRNKMNQCAEAQDYERAARFRDQLKAISTVVEGQSIAMKVRGEQDAIAFVVENDRACVQVFMIRHAKLIGRENFTLKGVANEEPQQIITSFIKQFYSASPYIPKLLLTQYHVDEKEVIENWLSGKKKARVYIETPDRGKKKELIDIVAENARLSLDQLKVKELAMPSALTEALIEIQKALELTVLPSRIEGYDISNIQGTDAVGSMVVFKDGKPEPAQYRRFKIKTVEGSNDNAMLKEMLQRRFQRAVLKEPDRKAWAIMPDLVLIDGGKGQLNTAIEVLRDAGLLNIPVAGLAKENEEIFLPGLSAPLNLPPTSAASKLLQRLRDEAHRFAITYFRKVHKKRTFKSALDEIPGIGPQKKKALIKHFGGVQGIRQASEDELLKVKGINGGLAKKIKESL
jgi:excinuclease ABC subunit C